MSSTSAVTPRSRPPPMDGTVYLDKMLRYLAKNKQRLSQPPAHLVALKGSKAGPGSGSFWAQTYTLATLGLDPTSSPLNSTLTNILTLGLSNPSVTASAAVSSANGGVKPLTLRLPPDRLLFLLLLFQATPTLRSSPNIGPLDQPLPDGLQLKTGAESVRSPHEAGTKEGDVKSVQSWVGSLRSAFGTVGSTAGGGVRKEGGGGGWSKMWGGKREELDEDDKLRIVYAAFTILPSLSIHRPSPTEPQIKDLVYGESYTSYGGIEVKIPLNVFRSLWELELDGYDPRGVIIPSLPNLQSLTVRDVQDGEDWVEELLEGDRFPSLRFLALPSTNLLSLPTFACPSLVHLDLSSNLLNAIPPSLADLPSLQSLNLSDNMIESVRGAENILKNVRAINLRKNRIDCLAGLDGVQSLERVDVRYNEIKEGAEVGRLALLPKIREVWAGTSNEFVDYEDDWRHNVFLKFAEEGNWDVFLDGYQMTWAEKRAVQADLAKEGRFAQLKHSIHERNDHTAEESTQSIAANLGRLRVASPPPSKRRRQRIVDLEGNTASDTDDSSKFHNLRLANRPDSAAKSENSPRTSTRADMDNTDMIGSGTAQPSSESKTKKNRKKRQGNFLHETIQETKEDHAAPLRSHTHAAIDSGDADPSDVRARIEALRSEVGDSWLRVLAGQQQQQQSSTSEDLPMTGGVNQQEQEISVPVQVQVKKGKKKKATGVITQ